MANKTILNALSSAAGAGGSVGEYWLYEGPYYFMIPAKNKYGTGIVVYERVSTAAPADNRFAMVDNDTGEITSSRKLSGTGLGYLGNFGTAQIGQIDDDGILHISFTGTASVYAQLDINNNFNVNVIKDPLNNGSYFPNNTFPLVVRHDPDRDTVWTAGYINDARNVNYQYTYGVYVHSFYKTTLADYQDTPVPEYNVDSSIFGQLFYYDLFEAEGTGSSAIYDEWYGVFKGATSYGNNGTLAITKYNYQAQSQGDVQLTYNNSSIYRTATGGGYYVNSGGNKYVVTCGRAYHDTTANALTANINVMDVDSFPTGVSWTEISPLAGDNIRGSIVGVDVDRTNNSAYFLGHTGGQTINWAHVAKTPIVPTTTGPTWWAKIELTGATSGGYVQVNGIQYDDQGTNPALIITGYYRYSSESATFFVGRFPADLNTYFGSTLGPFTISNASSSHTWDDQPGFPWEARYNQMSNSAIDIYLDSGTPSYTATTESLTAEVSSL